MRVTGVKDLPFLQSVFASVVTNMHTFPSVVGSYDISADCPFVVLYVSPLELVCVK